MRALTMNQLNLNSIAVASLGLGALLGGELDRSGSTLNAHVHLSSSAVAGTLIVVAVGLRLASLWVDRKSGTVDQATKAP